MTVHPTGKTLMLLFLGTLLAVQTHAYRDNLWMNIAAKDRQLNITRDIEVPALCWRSPWQKSDEAVKPYYRDRFMLGFPASGKKIISKHIQPWILFPPSLMVSRQCALTQTDYHCQSVRNLADAPEQHNFR